MNRRIWILGLAFAGLIGLASMDATAANGSAFNGTWMLNTASSDFAGAPAPTSGKVVISTAKKGQHKVVVDLAYAGGRTLHYEYTAATDGAEAPVTGSPLADSVSMLAPDANTVIRTDRRAGKLVSIATSTVDAHHKSFTSKTRYIGTTQPQPATTTVWERTKK